MFDGIKLGSLLMALALFAFPWLDIQCSEKSLATQTGFQVITGSSTPAEMGDPPLEPSTEDKDKEETLDPSVLVALALIAVIAGIVCSLIAILKKSGKASLAASILSACALGFILLQMMIRFPAETHIKKAISEESAHDNASNDPMAGMGSSVAAMMMSQIKLVNKPALYLELLALAIPSLLLIANLKPKSAETTPPPPAS